MIIETKVCGSLPREIRERLTNTQDLIRLNNADVAWCVKGKKPFIIEGRQEEESSMEFLKSFFTELAAMEQLEQSTRLLFHVTMPSTSMEEMEVLNRMFELCPKNGELKWGLSNQEGIKSSIVAVLTH